MKPTILVADDDAQLVDLLQRALVRAGYAVVTAANGTEAYQRLQETACGCMLLDITMPGINGPALLLLMQADDIRTPVIILTGSADFSLQEMKQFTNVVDLLRKPFQISDLLAALQRHLPRTTASDPSAPG